MDIFVMPEWSNLTKLSALRLSGNLGGYEAIHTFPVPDLKQLALHFDGDYIGSPDPPVADHGLPLFGAFCSLTKLEICSAWYEQVHALYWHSMTHTEGARNTI